MGPIRCLGLAVSNTESTKPLGDIRALNTDRKGTTLAAGEVVFFTVAWAVVRRWAFGKSGRFLGGDDPHLGPLPLKRERGLDGNDRRPGQRCFDKLSMTA